MTAQRARPRCNGRASETWPTRVNTLPYQAAFDRIHTELLERPGMCLTPEQVERLSSVDRAVCQCVLDDLVRARFLRALPNGSYSRVSDAPIPIECV
jgi:hypothetical protein